MKILRYTLLTALLSAATAIGQTPGNVEAYSRIYKHRDGTRTESFKSGNKREIQEFTYNKNDILQIHRMFVTDSKGRCRRGFVFDGKKNPLGSIEFGFDSKSDQLVEERTFNSKGQLIRRLFYPGTVKIDGLKNRYVALYYDPNNPAAKPVQSTENAKPVRPVESDQDEFEPGVPVGNSAPAANAVPSTGNGSVTTTSTPAGPRKRFFLPGNSSATPPPPVPSPPPPSAAVPAPKPPASPPPATVPAPAAPSKGKPARKPQT